MLSTNSLLFSSLLEMRIIQTLAALLAPSADDAIGPNHHMNGGPKQDGSDNRMKRPRSGDMRGKILRPDQNEQQQAKPSQRFREFSRKRKDQHEDRKIFEDPNENNVTAPISRIGKSAIPAMKICTRTDTTSKQARPRKTNLEIFPRSCVGVCVDMTDKPPFIAYSNLGIPFHDFAGECM